MNKVRPEQLKLAIKDLAETLDLYRTTYCDTQTHPTVIQECAVMMAMKTAFEKHKLTIESVKE